MTYNVFGGMLNLNQSIILRYKELNYTNCGEDVDQSLALPEFILVFTYFFQFLNVGNSKWIKAKNLCQISDF